MMVVGFQGTYSIFNVGRVVAGVNSIDLLPELVTDFDVKKVLIITDQGVCKAGLIEKPKRLLEGAGMQVSVIDTTPPEPEVRHVEEIFAAAKGLGCDLMIGIGGGSAMDVAKIVAVMLTNPVTMPELLTGAKIKNRGIPTFMIPTTAGTGAEATQNAIFMVPEQESKIGIVSSKLVPDIAILDPVLSVGLPPAITASTGMDALCHAIECFISKKANPLSDTYALRAVNLLSRSIRKAYKDGKDIDARHDMLLGAMFGGMCIASSGTTAVHALAYPLGGKFRMPHGLSNAMLLPAVMKFNLDAAQEQFKDIAVAMGLDVAGLSTRQAAEAMIDNLYALIRDLDIPTSLTDKGLTAADLDVLVEGAAKVTRLLNNNPKPMTKDDIRAVYQTLL